MSDTNDPVSAARYWISGLQRYNGDGEAYAEANTAVNALAAELDELRAELEHANRHWYIANLRLSTAGLPEVLSGDVSDDERYEAAITCGGFIPGDDVAPSDDEIAVARAHLRTAAEKILGTPMPTPEERAALIEAWRREKE